MDNILYLHPELKVDAACVHCMGMMVVGVASPIMSKESYKYIKRAGGDY